MEMCTADSVTAITSLMDTEEGLNRLKEALLEADRRLEKRVPAERPAEPLPPIPAARPVMTIYEAWNRPKSRCRWNRARGISPENMCTCIRRAFRFWRRARKSCPQAAETMVRYKEAGLALQGLKDYRAETIPGAAVTDEKERRTKTMGKLLVIEGSDGSGKATQTKLLYEALQEYGESGADGVLSQL